MAQFVLGDWLELSMESTTKANEKSITISTNKEDNIMTTEQELQLQALEHLIEAEFATEKSCQSVCLLTSQLLRDSDDKLMQMLADVAHKAYQATTDNVPMK